MKKLSVVTIAVFALFAFALAPLSQAGEGCTGSTSAKVNKEVNAKMASATKACTAKDAEACAASMGMTPDECKALCSQYSLVKMDIQGMTCGGCEKSIEAALVSIPGVKKVAKVSHKEGKAYLFVDPKKAGNDLLVKTVTDKGYEAGIIPAVATAETETMTKKASSHDGSGCTAAQKAACAAKGLPCGTKTDGAKATNISVKKKADGSK